MKMENKRSSRVIALLVGSLAMSISATESVDAQTMLRGEVEEALLPIEAAYRAAPGDTEGRRAYADILFKLGRVWEAKDVIAPLATASASHVGDLELGARLALLTSDYARAEALFDRLRSVADPGSESHTEALEGLVMVYYQTNQYAKTEGITVADEGEGRGLGTLFTFMQRFEGVPYGVEWATPEKVAHLHMINDITRPGALPLMKLEINGHPVEFILDTGGDRLYIDEGVASRVGIKTISQRTARYAYTGGEQVNEPLGVAESVEMGGVTLENVPVTVAKWKVMGPTSDGVVTTHMLKQFLTTVDYDNLRITFRERSERGREQLMATFADKPPTRMPFFMTATHLMFAKGSLNGHEGMNYFMDSGLASSMPIVILDETVEFLGLDKNPIDGTKYYWSPIESHGLAGLVRGATQAMGNVLVGSDSFWGQGFMFDVLLSHQYLRHLGSWTIDFDTMSYYFPEGDPR